MKKLSNILTLVGILCFLAYGFYLAGYETFEPTLMLGLIFLLIGLAIKVVLAAKELKGNKK
ncbi:MAG: hypothetical protein KBT36_07850 [Kurthia sp.]|nr:hypothetical protein [Candidatus Kurthia equi]